MSPSAKIFSKVSSSIAPAMEKVFKKLGSDPDPIITIIALCAFNMTVRPLITLTDKNQPKDRRLYAALREFVTELIALPTCVIMARGLGGLMAARFTKSPNTVSSVKNVFSFAGLILANFIIPIIATLALDPIMKDVKKKMLKNKSEDVKNQTISKPNNLNIVSKSQVLQPQTTYNHTVTQPKNTDNIWKQYNFTTSRNLKIGQ